MPEFAKNKPGEPEQFVEINGVRLAMIHWSALGLIFDCGTRDFNYFDNFQAKVRIRNNTPTPLYLDFAVEMVITGTKGGAAAAKYRCLRDFDAKAVKSYFHRQSEARKHLLPWR